MPGRIRRELHALKTAEPGTRFQEGYERTHVHNHALRIGLIVLGFALMVTAAVTFFLPGPNFVLVLAGLALVGGQSQTVAKWMDRGEVAGRRWHEDVWEPYPHKRALLGTVAIIALAAIAAALWIAWGQGWIPGVDARDS
jgi:hypothetical protein